MPTYVYENCGCDGTGEDTFELNVPINARDTVECRICGIKNKRKIAFNGLTWAPTAGGMR